MKRIKDKQRIKIKSKVEKTDEQGFVGRPSEWFSDKAFNEKFTIKPKFSVYNDSYFNSYSTFHIHEEMIKDEVRTESYRAAIENNKEAFKDKIILDVGCGTGILSIFAARAGAKHVYSVDNADIADYAAYIVKQNKLSDKITVIKGRIEDIKLPESTVDIIISEWMGYFLLYENMLDSVLYARDKWLIKDGSGIILPDRAVLNIAAIEDEDYKKEKLNFWEDIYGIDMSCLKQSAMAEPLIEICEQDAVNSTVCRIFEIDLYRVQREDLEFSSRYQLEFIREDKVHALVGWFDIFFESLPNKVTFSTSPFNKPTHWKQTVFYLEEDLQVNKGKILNGSIAVRKSMTNERHLDIKISVHLEDKYNYVQMYKLR